ncbi:hypothetical protein I4U23_015801 [Adineta vaga]|nr:hypothetical protein I4U23_015801 [Adineta vaga]
MGCSDSKSINTIKESQSNATTFKEKLTERLLNADLVKGMSKKAFVSVLNKYPEAKKVFKVPETTKTDAELVDTKEVQAASDKLLNHYMDIVKTSDDNLDAAMRKKADELNKLGVKAEYVKCYGENLAQNAAKDTDNKLSTTEEKAWKAVINEITAKLTAAMAKVTN